MKGIINKENPIFQFWKLLWVFAPATAFLALIIGFFSLNTGMTGFLPPFSYAASVMIAAVFLPIYMLPAYYAYRWNQPKKRRLLWLNLLLGWTLVGYLICFIKATAK